MRAGCFPRIFNFAGSMLRIFIASQMINRIMAVSWFMVDAVKCGRLISAMVASVADVKIVRDLPFLYSRTAMKYDAQHSDIYVPMNGLGCRVLYR